MPEGDGRGSLDNVVAYWLFALVAMIMVMVVLGGVTRLTHSGLSMVEWRPVTGWLPPLGDTEWSRAFEAYKTSPEYQKINAGMTLAEFKGIFWLEYVHRLWGRIIGLAFFIPFVLLALRRAFDPVLLLKLAAIFALGALQGGLGWFMVKSGLLDRPDVSQYRLVAHFGLALIILGSILWLALEVLNRTRGDSLTEYVAPQRLRRQSLALCVFVLVVALSGGFVAGIDAGLIYNTFPLMGGSIVPGDYWGPGSPWVNAFENHAAVQFHHRTLAVGLVIAAVLMWWRWRGRVAGTRHGRALALVAFVALIQAGLGISTLLLMVPVSWAALHQTGAVALFLSAVWLLFECRRFPRHAAATS